MTMAEYVYSQITAPDSYFNVNPGGHGEQFSSTQENFFEDMIQTIETGTNDGLRKATSPFSNVIDFTDTTSKAVRKNVSKFLQ